MGTGGPTWALFVRCLSCAFVFTVDRGPRSQGRARGVVKRRLDSKTLRSRELSCSCGTTAGAAAANETTAVPLPPTNRRDGALLKP